MTIATGVGRVGWVVVGSGWVVVVGQGSRGYSMG